MKKILSLLFFWRKKKRPFEWAEGCKDAFMKFHGISEI